MLSADYAAFNPLNHEVPLPPFTPPPSPPSPSPDADIPVDQAPRPSVSPLETRPLHDKSEILVPGKNWEYVAEFPLHDLKPHPDQKLLFVGLNDAGIAELAEDILKRGLQNPIEILPRGLIVNGHQRFLACKLLGWDHIPVYIRHDFTDQPETAVNENIVQDNLQRKHLHPLEIARGYVQLRKLFEEQKAAGIDCPFTLPDLRSNLVRRFNISGRTLDRYLAALKAPSIIQNLCIQGHIPFQLVCRIGALSENTINTLLKRIENGEDLNALIEEYTRPNQVEQDPGIKALLAITRHLKRRIPEIEENLDNLPYTQQDIQECRPVLEMALELITNLLEHYKNQSENEAREALYSEGEEIVAELEEQFVEESINANESNFVSQ